MADNIVHHPEHEELNEQHLHLESMLEHVHHSASADVKPSLFLDELKHVRERVQSHFAFEEEGGYLHAALANAGHLQSVSEKLLQEHRFLLQQLDRLIDWAERGSGDLHLSAEFVRELEVLLRKFQQHEHREIELVQRAANESINAID